MKIVSFAELSGDVLIEDNYYVQIANNTHFILVSTGLYPEPSSRFVHPNMVAWQNESFETKTSWPSGRKKWFSHAGRAMYFVVPRERIGLIYEPGYSWVPVEINGCKFHLNVSGGTYRKGWGDWVNRQTVHVEAALPIKKLKLLADAALPINEAREVVSMDLMEVSPESARTFTNIVAGQVCRAKLRKDHILVPQAGCSWHQQPSQFIFDEKGRGHSYLCRGSDNGMVRYRMTHNDIDWLLTAQANQFDFPTLGQENNIGPILSYVDPFAKSA